MPDCTPASHDAIKASAATFAEATVFVRADDASDLVYANCRLCGSTLALPLGDWRDEDTEPMAGRDVPR